MAKLITGGASFIGAELARVLAGQGEKVVVFPGLPIMPAWMASRIRLNQRQGTWLIGMRCLMLLRKTILKVR